MVWNLVCSRICQLIPSLDRFSSRNAYAFPKHLLHQDPFVSACDLDASTPLRANRAWRRIDRRSCQPRFENPEC
jgi:hypothetical protein